MKRASGGKILKNIKHEWENLGERASKMIPNFYFKDNFLATMWKKEWIRLRVVDLAQR